MRLSTRRLPARVIILLALFAFSGSAFSQKTANIWYFGEHCGIDFNGPTPVPLTNGALSTKEGNSTICDDNGNLLFYTDGLTVWNNQHQPMPNGTGLTGGNSSTQSAIIVPKPGAPHLYWIFTAPEAFHPDGLRYSEVDMTLQGGLGDITANKNIPLFTPTAEKVTAIRHQNGVDFWVVTRSPMNHEFMSFLFTASGISTTPVISPGIIPSNGSQAGVYGCLRSSPDGSKIASATMEFKNVELFDFNPVNGQLSNPVELVNFGTFGAYGVEFSPNSRLLYVNESSWQTDNNLYQYDLTAGSGAAIAASRVTVGTATGQGGTLQLGPDGRIYHANAYDTLLGVIANPNTLGLGCNYDEHGFLLSGKRASFGLPGFVNTTLGDKGMTAFGICLGDTTYFSQSYMAYDSLRWNFGEPASGINNTSTLPGPKHLYADTGTFSAVLVVYNGAQTDTVLSEVTVYPYPSNSLGNDTILCGVNSSPLAALEPGANHLWSDSSSGPTFSAQQSGTYWLRSAYHPSCAVTDSIQIDFLDSLQVDLGNATLLCPGETLELDVTNPGATYVWHDGSTGSNFTISASGTVAVNVEVGACSADDSVSITYFPASTFSLGEAVPFCFGDQFTLDATMPEVTYLWQDGSIAPTQVVSAPGTYWVELSSECGTTSDTLQVLPTSCSPLLQMPNVFSPNSDGWNDFFTPLNEVEIVELEAQVMNRWGNPLFSTTDKTIGWDGKNESGREVPEGTYFWVIRYTEPFGFQQKVAGSVTLVR